MTKQEKDLTVIDQKGRIYLRELTVDDVSDAYVRWMTDPDVLQFLECRFVTHSAESIRNYVQSCSDDPRALLCGIYVREGDRHIGNIKIHRIDRIHNSADMSLMIGDKTSWGKGYGSEAIRLLSDHSFDVLGLHKITAECYANNTGSYKAFRKAGFKEEGKRESHFMYNDRYVDGYILGLVCPTTKKK